jgi:hypothetical protein
MSYTARELITRAWYLTGIVGRQFQTTQGDELADGLFLFNELLAEKTGNISLIPYFKEYDFPGVIGQEKYFIPNMVIATTLTFYIDSVRYSTMPINRDAYMGAPRADGINSLPFSWHFERSDGGGYVYLYFTPDKAYPLKLWGKFSLDNLVNVNQDLLLTYERGYLVYLRYALAECMCLEYGYEFPIEARQKLRDLEYQFRNLSAQDLTIKKVTTLGREQFVNYADVNLGRGWTRA